MIDIEQTIASAKPESSLLMSYCASLSFFERDLLPYLQQAGAGSVTVLLDEAEYDATFSDLAQSVGIRYHLHPVRLPHPAANFHPKLYLLNTPDTATLLVASANLTPSGFRSNLEVVDQLILSETQLDDASAFGQYVQMLRILPTLDQRLPETLVEELASIATRLEHRGATAQSSARGPWFLHTALEPLMPQLVRLVPPKEVTNVTAISPFFDENSTAILELAKAYPNATIRLITNPNSGALNGLPLAKLGHRIKVDELRGPKRRLHAKLLLLSGVERDWVVSGSANLTRAAWLASAQSSYCGNVEAVVVRTFARGVTTRLLSEIKTHEVDYRTLRRDPIPPKNEPSGAPRLILIDAEFRHEHITIRVEGGSWYSRKVSFRILTYQGGKLDELAPTLLEDGNHIYLRVHLGRRSISGTPIAITVLAYPPSGIALQARTWVAVPGMLAMNSAQRQVRTAVHDVCYGAFGQDENAAAISEAISQFLTELGELSQGRTPGTRTNGSKQPIKEKPDTTISVEDFIVSDSALGSLRDSHNRLVQAFSGLAPLLQKLLLEAQNTEEAERAPLDHASGDDEDPEVEQKKNAAAKHPSTAKKATVLLAQISEEIGRSIDQSLSQPVSEVYLPFILSIPRAAIAYIRVHGELSKQWKMNLGHGLAFTIRDVLEQVFSIAGVLGGGSFGWLVEAWANDKCNMVLLEQLTDTKRVEDFRVFVAAGLAVGGPVKSGDKVASSILAGLHLLTGTDPRTAAMAATEQRLKGTPLASVGAIDSVQMEEVLRSYDPMKLDLLPIVRFWTTLSEIDETRDAQPTTQVLSDMETVAPGVWRDYLDIKKRLHTPLTRIWVEDARMSCCSCHRVLPANISMRFPPSRVESVHCSHCHRLIVPLPAGEDDIVKRVSLWLRSLPGERADD